MRYAAILALLILVAAPAGAQAPAPVAAVPLVQNWTHFSDPEEGAFRVEVPQGWRVAGGTVRRNALQYRSWVSATAPDGATILAINDPSEWGYVVPSPLLAAAGFREGSLYNGGGGTTYMVAHYRNGEQFAAWWGRRKLAALCGAVKLTESRARPELTAQINAVARAYGIQHDAGEARFACVKAGQAMTAYILASVMVIGGPAGAIWYAETIAGVLSPSPVAGIAAGLLAHMLASVEVNPAWVARQSQTNLDVSRIAARSNAAISDGIMRSWESRGAVIDRVLAEDERARLGIDVYADPATGTKYTVANDHKFYWANPSGVIVGTETDAAPKGFSRLERVPPQ
ncbi:MAG TPA: hypothetical protein VFA50_10100 [Stellaceae bacterium]|nr:hypothetical protein [Stellaceae bacterium]